MTNAEKFKEVFGFDVDKDLCPFPYYVWGECYRKCKFMNSKRELCTVQFWNSEFKEENK